MTAAPAGLSVVIVARNEAGRLPRCIGSAAGADEVVVVDHQSSDGTGELAARLGARVVRADGRLGHLRRVGHEAARGEWILSLDADEALPPEGLAAARAAAATVAPDVAGFLLPIRTYLGDRFLRWGGYYPARRIRLYRRALVSWAPEQRVHERPRLAGRVLRLEVPLEHHSYHDLAHARRKLLRYAAWSALALREQGRVPSWWGGLARAGWRWFRGYLLRGGFLMGRAGFALAGLQAKSVWYRTRWARTGELPEWAIEAPPASRSAATLDPTADRVCL